MKATSLNRNRFWFAAALVLCCRIGTPASAETITFQFTGEIDADGPGQTTFSSQAAVPSRR